MLFCLYAVIFYVSETKYLLRFSGILQLAVPDKPVLSSASISFGSIGTLGGEGCYSAYPRLRLFPGVFYSCIYVFIWEFGREEL